MQAEPPDACRWSGAATSTSRFATGSPRPASSLLEAAGNAGIVARTLVDHPQRHVHVELWPNMLRVDAVSARIVHLVSATADLRR
ncbi:MAG: hypothetical protein QOF53_2090, partial [Nocardioidaceae bacterium]|nr:hypothetical protein [Nocardioidaceae bacterium]